MMQPSRPMQLAAQTQMSIRVRIPAMRRKVRSRDVIIYKYYAYVGSENNGKEAEDIGGFRIWWKRWVVWGWKVRILLVLVLGLFNLRFQHPSLSINSTASLLLLSFIFIIMT